MLSLPELLGWGNQGVGRLKVSSQRSKAELLGLAEGVLADGVVVLEEARFLRDWIDRHFLLRDEWPASALFPRLEEMLADGVLDKEEQAELLTALRGFVDVRATGISSETAPPTVAPNLKVCEQSPFDDPAPKIEFTGRRFVVTGDFAWAARSKVVGAIEQRGGLVVGAVSKKVHYLLVGSMGSDLWKRGNWGTKIEAAVKLKRAGVGVAVVRECDWVTLVT